MLIALLIVLVFSTSVLSGIIGMAGGIILIAALVHVMPVANAMILHGFVQGFANGSRAWFLRKDIIWSILPWYLLGTSIATVAFALLTVVPDINVVLIIAGSLPVAANFLPSLRLLDITRPTIACVCGFIVTTTQLLAGASGPALDLFYQKTTLNRFQVVASKAIAQTIGHVAKTIYFLYVGYVVTSDRIPDESLWIVAICVITAVLGTRLGTHILGLVAEQSFRRYVSWAISAIGLLLVAKGLYGLVAVSPASA